LEKEKAMAAKEAEIARKEALKKASATASLHSATVNVLLQEANPQAEKEKAIFRERSVRANSFNNQLAKLSRRFNRACGFFICFPRK